MHGAYYHPSFQCIFSKSMFSSPLLNLVDICINQFIRTKCDACSFVFLCVCVMFLYFIRIKHKNFYNFFNFLQFDHFIFVECLRLKLKKLTLRSSTYGSVFEIILLSALISEKLRIKSVS